MYSGGTKFQKTQKTKYKKSEHEDQRDEYSSKQNKFKHHDKTFYRLRKREEKDYELY